MLYAFLRPLIFRLDPERAHGFAMAAARALHWTTSRSHRILEEPSLSQNLWGLHFPNPIGLAGGFDKSAEAPHAWAALGFGFAELGTITAEAQDGNPKPRIFRVEKERALINRLGFNNQGAAAAAARLARGWRKPAIPIGINLGKSRTTPLQDAVQDYERSLRVLFPFADYFALNVSSPNTPGLRDLQAEGEMQHLLEVLGEANRDVAREYDSKPAPLLVKISPDLSDEGIAATVRSARDAGAAGIIATNTTISREGLSGSVEEMGGLSGEPLRVRSTRVIRLVREVAGGLPIIGVGGIFNADDALEKFRAGAWLIQIYTGLIYEGPFLARRIVRDLARRLQQDNVSHVAQIVGTI